MQHRVCFDQIIVKAQMTPGSESATYVSWIYILLLDIFWQQLGDIWGGVRLRSRLSPGGGQNQKCHFKAKTDAFFINSFIYRAYYVKSYKKNDQKAQHLDITSFTMGLGPRFYQKSAFLFKTQYFCDFHIRRPIQHGPGERGDQDVSEYLWHIGVRSYFSTDIGCQSWVTYISNLFRFGHILFIFQVLPQDQPGRPETNRTSKQP